MLDAGNLWDLVVARAEATPDDVMAVDQDGRELTFAAYRDQAEAMAAGFADLGIGEGDVVSWQLPTWLETLVLVAALSRLGATQNPMLPIYREKEVGFVTRQAGTKLLVVPGTWRGYDYTAMGEALAAQQPGLSVLDGADRRLPTGDPSTLPPPPVAPASPDDLPVRWYYYTSGTTADPKGAQHTDATIEAAARGMCEALDVQPRRPHRLRVPVHARGRRGLRVQRPGLRVPHAVVEAFDAEATPPILRAGGVTLAGAGTPFHQAYLAYQRAHPDEAPIFPELRALIGGGTPKPPQLHIDARDELGGIGICSGYGMTEAPIVTMAGVRDTDQQLADTEGAPVAGVDLILVKLDGTRAARRRGGRDPGRRARW